MNNRRLVKKDSECNAEKKKKDPPVIFGITDLIREVLLFLPSTHILIVSRVCRRWWALVKHDRFLLLLMKGTGLYALGGFDGEQESDEAEFLHASELAPRIEQASALFADFTASTNTTTAAPIDRAAEEGTTKDDAATANSTRDDSLWRKLRPMNRSRSHFGCFVKDRKIYAVGGRENDEDRLDNFSSFDPFTEKWTELPSLPHRASAPGVAVVGWKVFVFGGYDGTLRTSAVVMFDLERPTEDWVLLEPLPESMSNAVAASYGTNVYLFGGTDDGPEPRREILKYDLVRGCSAVGAAAMNNSSNFFGSGVTYCSIEQQEEGTQQSEERCDHNNDTVNDNNDGNSSSNEGGRVSNMKKKKKAVSATSVVTTLPLGVDAPAIVSLVTTSPTPVVLLQSDDQLFLFDLRYEIVRVFDISGIHMMLMSLQWQQQEQEQGGQTAGPGGSNDDGGARRVRTLRTLPSEQMDGVLGNQLVALPKSGYSRRMLDASQEMEIARSRTRSQSTNATTIASANESSQKRQDTDDIIRSSIAAMCKGGMGQRQSEYRQDLSGYMTQQAGDQVARLLLLGDGGGTTHSSSTSSSSSSKVASSCCCNAGAGEALCRVMGVSVADVINAQNSNVQHQPHVDPVAAFASASASSPSPQQQQRAALSPIDSMNRLEPSIGHPQQQQHPHQRQPPTGVRGICSIGGHLETHCDQLFLVDAQLASELSGGRLPNTRYLLPHMQISDLKMRCPRDAGRVMYIE